MQSRFKKRELSLSVYPSLPRLCWVINGSHDECTAASKSGPETHLDRSLSLSVCLRPHAHKTLLPSVSQSSLVAVEKRLELQWEQRDF